MLAAVLVAVQLHAIVPEPRNLQLMSFWVADGAGYFRDEGIELVLDVPPTPGEVRELLAKSEAPIAVLPPPIYLELIGERQPWRLVANLLRNDPINVVVRRSVVLARKILLQAPVDERLRALRGVRIAVPPGPASRFRALPSSDSMARRGCIARPVRTHLSAWKSRWSTRSTTAGSSVRG